MKILKGKVKNQYLKFIDIVLPAKMLFSMSIFSAMKRVASNLRRSMNSISREF